jgi:hypothetical protein
MARRVQPDLGEIVLTNPQLETQTMKNSTIRTGMKVTAGIKAGALSVNHARKLRGIKVSSGIKAGEGIQTYNHNRRLA